jgi:prepilin-type N-terminal cleavage/methylation domain-containing protein
MRTNPESSMSAEALAKEEGRMSEVGAQSPEIRNPHSKGFTLVELLVVVAVILILMGLLFPALIGARDRARLTRARSEIQTLQEAWLAYGNLYGSFPTYEAMTADAVKVLGGENIDDNNPQEIAFMEFDERHRDEGFVDPWWNGRQTTLSEHLYKIELGSESADEDIEWRFTTRVHCVNTARYRY